MVGSADTLEAGLRLATKLRPDLILLDLKLPDSSSIDGVGTLARTGARVVIFTAHDTEDDVFRAIKSGARGYLLKGSPAAEIVQAIRQVQAGDSYLSPRIAATLVKQVKQPRGRQGLLTARERGVLRLVAAGLSNKEIGKSLSISERTVKFHVTAILNKLGAENRAQAVALGVQRGFLPDT